MTSHRTPKVALECGDWSPLSFAAFACGTASLPGLALTVEGKR